MKKRTGGLKVCSTAFVALFAILLTSGIHPAIAQTSRIASTITNLKKQNTYLGRELWFTMCKNADRQSGQNYTLYVTSPKKAVVNIHSYGSLAFNKTQGINAGEILTFDIPVSFELETSGIVEDKALHVWSEDADLSAYVLSHNGKSSDGMLIIPTTGWGTEYVVASFPSLQPGYGGIYDYPAEFAIVADQNYTDCAITPHDDIRASNDPNVTMHPAGVTFHELLMRGQCVQYQTIPATDIQPFDVTGTVVTSNNPVGVIGASQCSNVPFDKVYCDHICDMLPPTRTWAVTYQTVPFAGRKCGDTFIMLSTKKGQQIYRYGASATPYIYTVNDSHGFHEENGIAETSTWTSDAPFMLVQYINSSSYETECNPSNTNPLGDPSMVVINSVEQYANDIVFQTPSINSYVNYVNVMVADSAINKTTYDGAPISSRGTKQIVPLSNYTAFQITNVLPGKHEVKSDSGLGVYIYGYGNGESYAWSGALGLRTYNDPDTTAPLAIISGDCFNGFVTITDNQKSPPASQISEMKLDSLFNMRYTPDPNYVIGIAQDSTSYGMNVLDSTKEAYLQIEIHDYAGNRTLVTSTYKPQTVSITPSVLNFGSGAVGVTACKDFTITNTGKVPYTWQSLLLLFGNKGYSISSLDNSPIDIGKSRTVHICFTPQSGGLANDTLFLSDGCISSKAIVTGTGGQADFTVTGEDFGCQLVGSATTRFNAIISNVSNTAIQIDNIKITPPGIFVRNSPLPITIAANGQFPVSISFTPNATGSFTAQADFISNQIGTKSVTLSGCGIAPGSRITADLDTTSVCGAAISFADTIISTGTTTTTINSIVMSDTDQNFQLFGVSTPSGQAVGLPPFSLEQKDTVIAYINFYPPNKTSGVFTTQIFGITDLGDTTNKVTTRIRAIYREVVAKNDNIIIPIVAYGNPAVTGMASYCNDMTDSVKISGASLIAGSYNKAYTITDYLVNGSSRKPPFELAGGECLNIVFSFNPSYSTDSSQPAQFILSTNACIPVPAGSITAGTAVGAPQALGFSIITPILSCETQTDSIVVVNPSSIPSVVMTITKIAMKHSPSNFIPQLSTPATVAGGKSLSIPVVFEPMALPSLSNYQDTAIVTVKDAGGNITILEAPVSASASGMNAIVTPSLSVNSATAGSILISLPITIAVTKNQISANISELGITKIKLRYKYATNLLEPVGDKLSVAYVSQNGWKIETGSSTIDDATGTLTLVLTNNAPLDDGMTSLGEIHFYPTLTQSGTKETPLSLISSELFVNDSTSVGNCIGVSAGAPADFSLVYTCGDSSLAKFLKTGQVPLAIMPANPNPVSKSTGGVIRFQYAVRAEGFISFILYNGLGQEAARIIDGKYCGTGSYETQLDIRNLASGVYLYRFQLGTDQAVSGKVIIEN